MDKIVTQREYGKNKKMYQLLLISLSCAVAFFIGLACASRSAVSSIDVGSTADENKIMALQETVNQLRRENAVLTHQINTPQNKKNSDKSDNSPMPVASESTADAGQWETMSRIQDFNQYLQDKLKTDQHYNYAADLAQRFDDESIDPDWATNQQQAVATFFRDAPALTNVVPESIICKTERCRIRIPAANVDEANRIGLAISAGFSAHDAFKSLSVATALDSDQGLVDIYLPKDRQVILFN